MAQQKITITSSTRVAIYIRVSTLHQIDKDSLPMQKQDLITYANLMLGTTDCVVFEDAGYSGKNTDRPRFQEMMSQVRQGLFSHVLVWKIDRISRNLLDFATMYTELKDLGVIFVSKNEQFDTSTAMGEAMLKIILVFAELERNMTSERVTATMISRAANGQWNGGRIPFGYNYDPETKEFSLNESESELVKLIHNLYEDEKSLVHVSRYLNSKGYTTRAGGLWNPVSLHLILHSVFNSGDYQYNRLKEGDRSKVKDKSEWILVENHHIPIIDKAQKTRILASLDDNSRLAKDRSRYGASKSSHLFAKLLHCGNCGRMMGSSLAPPKKDWRYSSYACPTKRSSDIKCSNKHVSDPLLGEFVFNYILNILNAQNHSKKLRSPSDMQTMLLSGMTFKNIESIESDGLNDLYNVLKSGNIGSAVYGKNIKIKERPNSKSELTRLKNEKLKIERALDRLTNLYLYSDEAISTNEYTARKAVLSDSLEDIINNMGFIASDSAEQVISDETFVEKASMFILTQKLTGKPYVSYKKLAMTVDKDVLCTFISSIMDSIVIKDGLIRTITFKNGLSHTFLYK